MDEIKKLTDECEFLKDEIEDWKKVTVVGWAIAGSLLMIIAILVS
ncbi:hypothetical protein [Weissella viridescens]